MPWCYTAADRSRWGHCQLSGRGHAGAALLTRSTVPVVGGTSNKGDFCHFPFNYKGAEYHDCIDDDYKQPWCFVDAEQSRWGLCSLPATGGTVRGRACRSGLTLPSLARGRCARLAARLPGTRSPGCASILATPL